jgi:tetratricopeptide (TPR) repeat protein
MTTSQKTSGSEASQHKNLTPVLICLALAILTIIAFWQIKESGFISLDDNIYVYENSYIQSGLNWGNIARAFSFELPEKIGHWHPLTWLSLMLDYSLFGLNPMGYHLVNLLLHILYTVFLFLILRRMTRATWPSAFVAVLFAIHPLHVESVAWVTERKDVLSTFFWMLTLGAYNYYVQRRELKRYALVILFFALGLMSKPMLVTLPFVLLLLDFWPLERFSEGKPAPQIQAVVVKPEVSDRKKKKSRKTENKKMEVKQPLMVRKPAEPEFQWSLIYPLLLEKVPLFVLAIISSVATYIAASSAGAISFFEVFPLDVRIGNAIVSYVIYIGKMILPVNLAVFYPHPGNVVLWQVLGSAVILMAITFVVLWRVKKSPYLATGWLWYVGTLVPVIGIVQAGTQAMADRYTYISLIGLFIMVAWGVPDLLRKWNYRREILLTTSVLVILCLSILTWKQVGYWQNSLTLYDHALKVTENNWFIHNSRGVACYLLGDYHKAIEDYDRAIEIKPDFPSSHYNRCLANNGLGNYPQALEDCRRAIELKQDYVEAYDNRGIAYSGMGKYNEAIKDYGRAMELDPMYAKAYYNRGIAYNSVGNYRQAIVDYGRAIELMPGYVDAYNNRGAAYYFLGNYRQAINDYSSTIEIKPDYTGAYKNRGIAYARLGNNNLAVNDLKTAAKLGDESVKNYLRSHGIRW